MPAVTPRATVYRVCVQCGRRDYSLPVIAADDIYGLCAACMAKLGEAKDDPQMYVRSRLPHLQL